MQNIILHLDMNSYFASVEQQDNPAWRGKPVGVCEHLGGIIIAASVEAKRWGIKTGTPVWEARKLYPKIYLTHTHPDRYRFYTRRLIKLVEDYTDAVEVYSIDEVFLDVTKACNVRVPIVGPSRGSLVCHSERSRSDRESRGIPLLPVKDQGLKIKDTIRDPSTPPRLHSESVGMTHLQLIPVDPYEEAVRMAKEIKQRMKAEVGDWLRCSIGIASNKLLAKIASDLQKPDGLVVITNQAPSLGDGEGRGEVGKNEKCKMKSEKCRGQSGFLCHSDRSASEAEESLCFSAKGSLHAPSDAFGFSRDDTNTHSLSFTKNQLYDRLALTDIPGIGTRMEKRLNELGIYTLRHLKDYPESRLVARFGLPGHHLYNMGQLEGSWKADVEQESEIKSIGHMYTLPKEYRGAEWFEPVLYKLCEMVARRLRRNNLTGNVLHVHIHDMSEACFGKSHKIGRFVFDGREIFLEAKQILQSGFVGAATGRPGNGKPVASPTGYRLIGVTVSGLKARVNQLSLFGDDENVARVDSALDAINDKYGDYTVCRVPAKQAGSVFRDSIGFGRIKELGRIIPSGNF